MFMKKLEHAIDDERSIVHCGFNQARAVGVAGTHPHLHRSVARGEEFEGIGRNSEPLLPWVTIGEIGRESLEQASSKDPEAPPVFELLA